MRRSGGFAGRATEVRLDSARMGPAEGARLVLLVSAVDWSRVGRAAAGPAVGADLMRYDLVVEHGGTRWEGTVADPSIPNEVRPLLQFLTAAAR
jgi:hypothetical protein